MESFQGNFTFNIEKILSSLVYQAHQHPGVELEMLFLFTNIHELLFSLSKAKEMACCEAAFKLLRTINRTIPPCVPFIGLVSNLPFDNFGDICQVY